MAIQFLIVSMGVGFCFAYAVWSLMPQTGRRALSKGLRRLPLPDPLAMRLQAIDCKPSGCSSCDGCARAAGSASTHVLRFHAPIAVANKREVSGAV